MTASQRAPAAQSWYRQKVQLPITIAPVPMATGSPIIAPIPMRNDGRSEASASYTRAIRMISAHAGEGERVQAAMSLER